jgi:CheY-like chemotaxis protein
MYTPIRKKILIIDDSADNQVLLKTLFESKGYEVVCVSNGHEGLSLLRKMPRLPDMILLDAQMPVMDGYEFRAEQRSIDRIKNIPVVVISGDIDQNMFEDMQCPEAILPKPFHLKSIVESVSAHIRH